MYFDTIPENVDDIDTWNYVVGHHNLFPLDVDLKVN